MKTKQLIPGLLLLCLSLFLFRCEKETVVINPDNSDESPDLALNAKGGKPGEETAGNNLSFPVIWAEGVAKTLPAPPEEGVPYLEGEWWYQWGTNGTDPNVTPASCPPDPDASDPELNPDGLLLCDDGIPGSVDLSLEAGTPAADFPMPLVKAFVQKDPQNVWQAGSADWSDRDFAVDLIDWGDNLESVDWYTKSQVRTEVVLFQNLDPPMLEYQMRHTSGWGIDEVHGLAASIEGNGALEGLGDVATVYSPCARFSIQKLNVDRDDPALVGLTWEPGEGWTNPEGENFINPPIFNMAVHEAQDGPGYYNAEINVKGRIIYGYTWNVRKLNEGAGCYRLTFSFDATAGPGAELNTFFEEGITEIKMPEEEELIAIAAAEAEPVGGGGVAVLVPAGIDEEGNPIGNLTYMDIRILERGGGGGGGKGGGGGNGGGKPN